MSVSVSVRMGKSERLGPMWKRLRKHIDFQKKEYENVRKRRQEEEGYID